MKYLIICILLTCLIFANDYKEDLKFNIFTLHGIGPISFGRGNTGVAVLDSTTIAYYNPAGLSFVKDEKVWGGFSYSPYWFGYLNTRIRELYVSGNYKIMNSIGIGGLFILNEWARKEGNFWYGDTKTLKLVAISYKITPYISIGTDIKQVTHKYTGTGLPSQQISEEKSVDFAGFYKFKHINYGLNLQNIIGSPKKMMLKNYKFGVSYEFPKFLVAGDINLLEKYGISPYCGIEIPIDEFVLRFGIYKTWPYNMITQKVFFYTGGVDFKAKKVNLSYGTSLFQFDNQKEKNKLGIIHKLSLQIEV